ncbi:MAG TPA: phosphopantetheine-binding protein [Solirubrobacteraceae bacterium]|jgi:acyl carrier protein|nr:phosphopantetheine-binding protein [Solirubrobacteraceae bacterium]
MPTAVTSSQIEETIFQTLAELGPELEDISRDATLEALDIDSLDLVEIAQVVEEEFGVRMTTDDVALIRTVGDAIDLLYERVLQQS